MRGSMSKTLLRATFHWQNGFASCSIPRSSPSQWPDVEDWGARRVGCIISFGAYHIPDKPESWIPTRPRRWLIFNFSRETLSEYDRTNIFLQLSTRGPEIVEWVSTPKWFRTVERCLGCEPASRNSSMREQAI